MALHGLDISSYQDKLDLRTISFDFVIIKATEGRGYVNPVCDKHYQQAKGLKKLRGIYHFGNNLLNSPITEADFFINNIKGYLHDSILVLDNENSAGRHNEGNVAWCKAWLDRVYARTGIRPLIYMNANCARTHNWSSIINANYGLWVAAYASSPPSVAWGKVGYVCWQYTSSGILKPFPNHLDLDVFYGDSKAWNAYAGVKPPVPAPAPKPPAPTPTPPPKPPVPTPTPLPPPEPIPLPPTVPPVDVPPPPPPGTSTWINAFLEWLKRFLGIK